MGGSLSIETLTSAIPVYFILPVFFLQLHQLRLQPRWSSSHLLVIVILTTFLQCFNRKLRVTTDSSFQFLPSEKVEHSLGKNFKQASSNCLDLKRKRQLARSGHFTNWQKAASIILKYKPMMMDIFWFFESFRPDTSNEVNETFSLKVGLVQEFGSGNS